MQDTAEPVPTPDSRQSLTDYVLANFPPTLLEEPYWLIWTPTYSAARSKYLKTPLHAAWQTARDTFPSLVRPAPSTYYGYGFMYHQDHPYICIDVDDGSPLNERLVQQLQSYSEWSPSSNGAHVIVRTNNKQALITAFGNKVHNTTEKRDLFISSGYVTITGRVLPIRPSNEIRTIPHTELIDILAPYFRRAAQQAQHTDKSTEHTVLTFPARTNKSAFPVSLIRATLKALPVKYLPDNAFTDFPIIDFNNPNPPESRTAWLTVGAALHNEMTGSQENNWTYIQLWSDWSQEGDKYDQVALSSTWSSFKHTPGAHQITFATIIKLVNAQRPAYVDFRGDPPVPMATFDNINIYVDHANITARYNTTTNNIEVQLPPRLLKKLDTADVNAVSFLIDAEMYKHGTRDGAIHTKARHVLISRATSNVYNPVVEHFTTTLPPWDHISRIPSLVGTIDCDPYNVPQYTKYIRSWLIQVMAAVFTTFEVPNRLNNVLILQGGQGIGKTMWVESLFPPDLRQYCVGSKSINMSQFRNDMVKLGMELTNTLICSINEIDTVFNSKTYSEFKAFLDNTTDKIVLPYGSTSTNILRRTVFIGSTNKIHLFTDTTGNRRFMLLNAASFNFKHDIDLNQLWAEAYYYYKHGEKWWIEDAHTLNIQRITNSAHVAAIDELLIDQLNNMFVTDSTNYQMWETYSFPRLRALLNIQVRPNTQEFKRAKLTITQWLQDIAPNISLVKVPTQRSIPWECKMPPLKLD